MIDKTLKWPIMSGSPLRTWVAPSCKCLILGDAAHSMVPYMSQGMCIPRNYKCLEVHVVF